MNDTIYHVYTRIEKRPDGYWAVAVAIPGDRPLRCAPASREARCAGPIEASRIADRVARELVEELGRRDLRCEARLQ
jgi:hypothetical protein